MSDAGFTYGSDKPYGEREQARHRSKNEIETFAAELEDFAVRTALINVKATYRTTEAHLFVVEFENNGEPTDKPAIKEVEI